MLSNTAWLRVAYRLLGILVLSMVCITSPPAYAQAQAPVGPDPHTATDTRLQNAVENIASIQQSIELKRSAIRELRDRLKRAEDTSEKQDIEQKIERIKNEITGLQESFNHIALGGINLSILTDQPEQKIDWRDEIEQISRPLLSTLKELTARPRQIDSLNRDIERLENQLRDIEKALGSIRVFKLEALPPAASEAIEQLLIEWEQRRDDTRRALEITRFKLDNLETESTAWHTSTGDAIAEFLRGRGLTLFLAIIAGLAIWAMSKALLRMYWNLLYRARHDIGIARAPLFYYSYRLATIVIIVLALLMVFYARGDVLLLTLALIALAGAALTLRQTLPRYAAELRLLLGVGPVRENERLVLDGVPYTVESLSVYSVLRNPSLEGVVRLPLHAMNELASRPAGEEPWFPCHPGDYIVLANGSYGRVLRQTIELLEVAILDSVVQIPTRDFLAQNIRNLTRNGFGIACTFGVDYQHQAICLDTVPERLRDAIMTRFAQAGLKQDIEDILVEFSQAGSSSLDYRIYLILNGRAGKAFYRAQRLVQQACVEACNRENWVIPFTQVTIHTGQEFPDSADNAAKTNDNTVQARSGLPPEAG